MKPDYFSKLPPELIIDILKRLSFGMIIGFNLKRVCKTWHTLIKSDSHELVKSVPGLAVYEGGSSKPYKVYEFADELDLEYSERYCYKLFSFSFPHDPELLIHSSVNGLLFLFCGGFIYDVSIMIICNPVTREHIQLPRYYEYGLAFIPDVSTVIGFGVTKMSGQYKVVRIGINHEELECHVRVYTLGTGSWRIIDAPSPIMFELSPYIKGVFVNGNYHWMAYTSICWIDLETELFSTFSTPCPILLGYNSRSSGISLSTLRDCLCLCKSSCSDSTDIWLMNSYGDETSRTKQFIISKTSCGSRLLYCPIKVFKDGDILIATEGSRRLLWHSSKGETMGDTCLVKYYGFERGTSAVTYTPSFLSLETFANEKVIRSFGGEGGSQQHQRKSMKRKKSE